MATKAKFQVGETVSLPMKIVGIDHRFNPPVYRLQSTFGGWVLDDVVVEKEIRPLTKRETSR